MPTKINPDITPRPEDYAALRKDGIPSEFVDWELKNCVEYFVDAGNDAAQAIKDGRKITARAKKIAYKTNWYSAIRKWMRRAFQGSEGAEFERIKDQLCSNRPPSPQDDLFNAAFNKIKNIGTVKVNITQVRKLPPPRIIEHNKPEQGPPCKPEDAFAEMRRRGLIE